jgi:hypothetical protein
MRSSAPPVLAHAAGSMERSDTKLLPLFAFPLDCSEALSYRETDIDDDPILARYSHHSQQRFGLLFIHFLLQGMQ